MVENEEQPKNISGAPITSCSASLRIEGATSDVVDFEEIEEQLGLTPTSAIRRGEALLRKGTTALIDVWTYQAEVERNRPLADHLAVLKQKLDPHADYLRSVTSKWNVSIYCDYMSDLAQGYIVVPASLTKTFGDYGVELVIYILSWGGVVDGGEDD